MSLENAGMPWKTSEDDHLLFLFKQGRTVGHMANVFRRSVGAIRARLERLGVEQVHPQTNNFEEMKEPKMRQNNLVTMRVMVGNTDASTLTCEELIDIIETEDNYSKRLTQLCDRFGSLRSEAINKLLLKHEENKDALLKVLADKVGVGS